MKFTAHGHPNILGTHKNTLEITKEEHLTLNGDCIIAVNANFDFAELKKLAQKGGQMKMTLSCEGLTDTVEGTLNPSFSDEHEIVLRLGEHVSERTLATRCDKAAKHIKRELIDCLKKGKTLEVHLETIKQE